ncbi:class I SAM-dependent methyltransferase [Candidatus Woesearchaeota archaeon]|nr:class I SAM-dependent methyltransferase [Candidatus Woesearchaeota archaeon]
MSLDNYLEENIGFYPECLSGDEFGKFLEGIYDQQTMNELDELFLRIHTSAKDNKARWDFLLTKGIYLSCLKNEKFAVKEGLNYVSSKLAGAKTVLDLGSGYGVNLIWLALQNPNARIFGIDFLEGFMNETKRLAEKYKVKNYSLTLADIQELPFPKEAFDVVVACKSLHEFQTDESGSYGSFMITIPEALKVTKQGGKIVGTLPVNLDAQWYVQSDLEAAFRNCGDVQLTQNYLESPNSENSILTFTAVKK